MKRNELSQKPLILLNNRIFRRYAGGREIDKFKGLTNSKDCQLPEDWVGSTTLVHQKNSEDPNLGLSRVRIENNGDIYLKELISADPVGFLGKKHVSKYGKDTDLLVKLLDAKEQLRLQTHPGRYLAQKNFKSRFGKVESWFIVDIRKDQREEPYILLGFKPGITRDKFAKLFLAGDIKGMENCCHKIKVKPGEMYFVDAGVPHAIGPGCFLIEVQEPSDITIGSDIRELEKPNNSAINKILECYKYNGITLRETLDKYKMKPLVLRKDQAGEEYILLGEEQARYFNISHLKVKGRFKARDTGKFSILIVLKGQGRIIYDQGWLEIKKGDELFLPAGIKQLYWESVDKEFELVRCHPPESYIL